MEGYAVKLREGASVVMIPDHQRNCACQFAGLLAMEQVRKTVQVFRDEDGHARKPPRVFDAPAQPEFNGQRFESRTKRRVIESERIQLPLDAHKEQAGFVIAMLVGMQDVRAVIVEKRRDLRDKAFAVGGIDEQDG